MTDLELTTHWVEQKVADFEQLCKKSGLKMTPQRLEIYQALVTTKEHPSAEVLWRQVRKVFPNISLDTVNRTLKTLHEIGAAFIVEGSGEVKRFDGGSKNHQHLRCVECRKVIDFHHEAYDNINVPAEICGNFKVLRKTVYIEGICEDCQKISYTQGHN